MLYRILASQPGIFPFDWSLVAVEEGLLFVRRVLPPERRRALDDFHLGLLVEQAKVCDAVAVLPSVACSL